MAWLTTERIYPRIIYLLCILSPEGLLLTPTIDPLIVVAGKGQEFVEKLITPSKGDAIVDYRKGDEAVVSGIKDALGKAGVSEVHYAFDGVSEHNSFQNISKVLSNRGKITLVLPGKDYSDIPEHIEQSTTMVGCVHIANSPDSEEGKAGIKTGEKDFGYVFFRLFSRGLEEGWFSGHPYKVVPGGLGGVETALADLQNGSVSATKYIFKIEDTK